MVWSGAFKSEHFKILKTLKVYFRHSNIKKGNTICHLFTMKKTFIAYRTISFLLYPTIKKIMRKTNENISFLTLQNVLVLRDLRSNFDNLIIFDTHDYSHK